MLRRLLARLSGRPTALPDLPPDPPDLRERGIVDNGPTALEALLAGFGIRADRDDLRRECGTDETGTSITEMEAVARRRGLPAREEMRMPEDLLLYSEQPLPALICATRPGGTAYLLLWRAEGDRIRCLDTERGVGWISCDELCSIAYIHEMPVPTDGWLAWARDDAQRALLLRRMEDLGALPEIRAALWDQAQAAPSTLAALDAAARWAEIQVLRGSLPLSAAPAALAARYGGAYGPDRGKHIPRASWSALPLANGAEILMRGAVLLQAPPRPGAPGWYGATRA